MSNMELEKAPSEFTLDGTVDFKGRPASRAKTGRWKACYFLIGYEAFERMAFYGIASNLVIYMTGEFHEGTVSSAKNVNNWSGVVWMTFVLGAFVADRYLGRYWTFLISALIYLLGMAMLTLSVCLKSLKPPLCDLAKHTSCNKASPLQIGFFFLSLYVLAVGTGGTKPNISTFGADQFDDFCKKEKFQKNSFFNWWIFSVFLGTLIAQSALIYIQENVGWGLGYGIPTFGLFLSVCIFMVGSPHYRYKKVNKEDNPISRVIKTIVTAFQKRNVQVPVDPSELFELDAKECQKPRIAHTDTLRFLDKAATRTQDSRHQLCTVSEVEETKMLVGMLPVWLVTLAPSVVGAQTDTFFVKQGTTMDRHLLGRSFEVPAASLGIFITLSLLIVLPIYDRFFVPFARKYTGNPRGISLLQRLGTGFAIQILVMAVASATEVRRLHLVSELKLEHTSHALPITIFWLLPQYILMGVADVFITIAMVEFFYDQAPPEMRSLGTSYFTCSLGLGNFLSSFLIMVIDNVTSRGKHGSWIVNNLNMSRLDYYYAFLAALCFLNMVFFVIVGKLYVYKTSDKDDRQQNSSDPHFKIISLELLPPTTHEALDIDQIKVDNIEA